MKRAIKTVSPKRHLSENRAEVYLGYVERRRFYYVKGDDIRASSIRPKYKNEIMTYEKN